MNNKDENITVDLKRLNNKVRKGLYYYIKKKSGNGRYFKFNENYAISDLVSVFNGEMKYKDLIKKTKMHDKTLKYQTSEYTKKQNNEYQKDIKKLGTIEENLKKGIITQEIDDIKGIDINRLDREMTEMMSKAVKNKSVVKILAKEENMVKMNTRFETVFTIHSKDKEIGSFRSITQMSPRRSIMTAKKVITRAMETSTASYKTKKALKEAGFNDVNVDNDEVVDHVSVKVIYRKA